MNSLTRIPLALENTPVDATVLAAVIRGIDCASLLLTVAAILFVLRMRRHDAPLGVSVPPAYVNHPVLVGGLRRYRRAVLVIGGVGIVGAVLLPLTASIIVTAIVPLVLLVVWLRVRRSVIQVKCDELWFAGEDIRIVGTITAQRADDSRGVAGGSRGDTGATGGADDADDAAIGAGSVDRAIDREAARIVADEFNGLDAGSPPWLVYIGAFLIMVTSSLYLAARWDEIPESFAVHFGPGGVADGWSDKGILGVYELQILNLGFLLLFLLFALSMNPRWIGFRSNRTLKARIQLATALRYNQMFMGGITLLMSVMLSVMNVNVALDSALMSQTAMLLLAVLPLMIFTLVGAAVMISKTLKTGEKVDALLRKHPALSAAFAYVDGEFGTDEIRSFQTPDMDRFYKGGMLYYNPDDPALLVDKHDGVGITANFAHWLGKLWIVALVMLIILPLSLSFMS